MKQLLETGVEKKVDFLKNVQNEVLVVWSWYTHQNEANCLKLAVLRLHLTLRAPECAPRAIFVYKVSFPCFSTTEVWRTFWCAWCPHSNIKLSSSWNWHQCRYFGGYTKFMRHLVQIPRNFEIQQNPAFWSFLFLAHICRPRAKKTEFWSLQRSEWVWDTDLM